MGLPATVDSEFGLDGAQLGRAITLLVTQINMANHRLLHLIAEFDRRAGWREEGGMRSCAHWLAAHCGMKMGAAREKVRVARCLEGLPEMDAAFAEGELSYSKIRAVTRVATPDNEGFMVGLAERHSASQLEKLVGKYQPVEEPGLEGLLEEAAPEVAAEDVLDAAGEPGKADAAPEMDIEARREQARELYWFQDEDGMWVIHGKLPPEEGQLVMKVLQAVARPLEEERKEEWQAKQKARMQEVARKIMQRGRGDADGDNVNNPGFSENNKFADGAIEGEASRVGVEPEDAAGNEAAVDDAAGNDAADAITPHGEAAGGFEFIPADVAYARAEEKISAETFSVHMNQIRADALVQMVEHFLASGPDYRHLKGLKGSERCQVVFHVDINTLREQRSGVCCTHGKAHYEDKPWLTPETARRLSCDASLVTVLEDENGQVLNVGRKSRVVPPHIRRALQERDSGVCQYDGCHESRNLEAHHVKHWSEGGETSLDNLLLLCKFHHARLHQGCFDVRVKGVSAET